MRYLLILIIVPLFFDCFSQNRFDKKTKRKFRVEITNRGLDFSKKFVVINKYKCYDCEANKLNWQKALFKHGIILGRCIDKNLIDGDYKFEIYENSIMIYGVNENYNLIATIGFSRASASLLHFFSGKKWHKYRNSVVKLLIDSQ